MSNRITRRRFLASGAAAGATFVIPSRSWHPLPPSERLKIAVVGCGGRGGSLTNLVSGEDVIALCDVDERRAAGSFRKHPKAKKYRDYRRLLDAHGSELDAIVVGTPDHMHAPIAIPAMEQGLHCYCEKPLTWSIAEARAMASLAQRKKLATQMGNQGSGNNGLRRGVELLRANVLGDVREAHVWTNRPVWPQSIDRPEKTMPVPDHFAWDLFLGCAEPRPYHKAYHPFSWRGWHDFGTGALGDMACHTVNLVWRGLELGLPIGASAKQIEGAKPESYPAGAHLAIDFPARGKRPPVTLHWYEGSVRPPASIFPKELGRLPRSGVLVKGTKGVMFSPDDYNVRQRWLPQELGKVDVPQTLPRGRNHMQEWLTACKDGGDTFSAFPIAGPFTEAMLVGDLALRTGKDIRWKAKEMIAEGAPEAAPLIRRAYRKGFGI